MTTPPRHLVAALRQRSADQRQQTLEQLQRQTGTGLNVGVTRERPICQVRHVVAGRIAMQHLQQESMHRRHRAQQSIPPRVLQFMAQPLDGRGLKMLRHIRLDLPHRGEDIAGHPWPPGSERS